MIEGIAGTIELRDPYTEGHHKRVGSLAVAIAREMKLTDFQIEGIELASCIYDIGMVNIPADILQDSERLEGLKLSMYQTYPEAAYKTLKKIECIWPIADVILQHRECFDGSGFPRGIKGDGSTDSGGCSCPGGFDDPQELPECLSSRRGAGQDFIPQRHQV